MVTGLVPHPKSRLQRSQRRVAVAVASHRMHKHGTPARVPAPADSMARPGRWPRPQPMDHGRPCVFFPLFLPRLGSARSGASSSLPRRPASVADHQYTARARAHGEAESCSRVPCGCGGPRRGRTLGRSDTPTRPPRDTGTDADADRDRDTPLSLSPDLNPPSLSTT